VSSRGSVFVIVFLTALLGAWAFGASGQPSPAFRVCRHPGADGGESRPVDLGRVGQEQARLIGAFRQRLRAPELSGPSALPERSNSAFASGVLGCLRPEKRGITLSEPLPPKLRGRRLFFLGVPSAGTGETPSIGPLEGRDLVFAVGRPNPESLAALGRRMLRDVTWASPALAARLKIRCVPSRVEVSPDGQTLLIEEMRP